MRCRESASLVLTDDRGLNELTLVGRNLTNAEGRNHVSFTKEFVPLTGRDVRLALRVSF